MSRRTPPSPKQPPKTPVPTGRFPGKKAKNPAPADKDTIAARIWVLREEGMSYRQIKAETGASIDRIYETLHSQPDRLQSLVASQREERSRLWSQFESQSLKQSLAMQEAAYHQFFTKGGKVKSGKESTLRRDGARWAAVMRQSANDAGGKINLLTGGPTERIAGIGNPDPDAGIVTAESIIDRAIRAGLVELLPPVLRVQAEAKMGAKQ